MEVAEGLVAGHAAGDRHHVGEGEGFGFGDLAAEEELSDFGDGFGGFGVVAVAVLAVPDGVIVEMDAFAGGVSEDAGSEGVSSSCGTEGRGVAKAARWESAAAAAAEVVRNRRRVVRVVIEAPWKDDDVALFSILKKYKSNFF